MNRLSLEALEVLDAIDRKGSFAAAATELFRVPSKVTYTVNKLEQDLGVSLFRKEGRKSVLTPAGRLMLDQGRELLLAADRLVEQTRQLDSGWESCLNIAVGSVYDDNLLYPVLEELAEEHRDIEINLYEEAFGGCWESLLEGRADLAVGALENNKQMPGINMTRMRTVQWVYAASPDHPIFERETISESELKDYRAVELRDSARALPAITRHAMDHCATLRVGTMQQKIDAQLNGLGLGFLPRFRIQHYLDEGQLVEIKLPDPMPDTPLYYAWRSGNKGRALQWLVEHLSQKVMSGEL